MGSIVTTCSAERQGHSASGLIRSPFADTLFDRPPEEVHHDTGHGWSHAPRESPEPTVGTHCRCGSGVNGGPALVHHALGHHCAGGDGDRPAPGGAFLPLLLFGHVV